MSLEDQLFRIFSHYAIHTDSSQPELWKSGTVIRFAKDCQILARDSKSARDGSTIKISSAEIELEIAKIIKARRADSASQYSTNITIGFDEFLILLQRFSKRCYPDVAAPVALRRLLLENTFLLANRRQPLDPGCDIHSKESLDALKPLEKGLYGIFTYYLDLADKRRNNELAGKIAKVASSGEAALANDMTSTNYIQQLKNSVKSYKDFIGYPEYSQFCADFQLRSLSLITALQSAEIYLHVASYETDMKGTRGLTFAQFLDTLLYMAHIAYRPENLPTSYLGDESNDKVFVITPGNRVKALLLFMWKAVNRFGDSAKAKSTTSPVIKNQHSFGSKVFSDMFFSIWQKDNFMDYTVNTTTVSKSGQEVLQSLLSTGEVASLLERSINNLSVEHTTETSRVDLDLLEDVSVLPKNDEPLPGLIYFAGRHFQELFAVRPDLKEFIALEVAKLEDIEEQQY